MNVVFQVNLLSWQFLVGLQSIMGDFRVCQTNQAALLVCVCVISENSWLCSIFVSNTMWLAGFEWVWVYLCDCHCWEWAVVSLQSACRPRLRVKFSHVIKPKMATKQVNPVSVGSWWDDHNLVLFCQKTICILIHVLQHYLLSLNTTVHQCSLTCARWTAKSCVCVSDAHCVFRSWYSF